MTNAPNIRNTFVFISILNRSLCLRTEYTKIKSTTFPRELDERTHNRTFEHFYQHAQTLLEATNGAVRSLMVERRADTNFGISVWVVARLDDDQLLWVVG